MSKFASYVSSMLLIEAAYTKNASRLKVNAFYFLSQVRVVKIPPTLLKFNISSSNISWLKRVNPFMILYQRFKIGSAIEKKLSLLKRSVTSFL